MGMLLDNLSRVYDAVSGKVVAKANDTEDNSNSKTTGEEKEEKDLVVTKTSTLSQFVEDNCTYVIDKFINPQIASKGIREMFKELFYKQLETKFGGKGGTKMLTEQYNNFLTYLQNFKHKVD
jgi:hypothetical protein